MLWIWDHETICHWPQLIDPSQGSVTYTHPENSSGGQENRGGGSCWCCKNVPVLIIAGRGLILSRMQQLLLQYMHRMSVPPSRALDDVLLLPPIVVLFRGGRIFERYLGLDEVLRIGFPRIG